MKQARLTHADFTTLSPLRKEAGRFFILTIAKNPYNKPRFATVVSKKTANKANQRNLIKRRLRAALREISPKQPVSFIFTAKKSAAGAEYADILSDASSLIVKAATGLKPEPGLQ